MLQKLPSAFFAGLRIREFDEHRAVVTVRYKWFTQNPFRSMYFAVQSMAAEMSTGLLASGQVYQRNPTVSMLVVGLEAKFFKKATDLIAFTCEDGDRSIHRQRRRKNHYLPLHRKERSRRTGIGISDHLEF